MLVCKCWERDTDDVTILRKCKYNCGCSCHAYRAAPIEAEPRYPTPMRQPQEPFDNRPRIVDPMPSDPGYPRIECQH